MDGDVPGLAHGITCADGARPRQGLLSRSWVCVRLALRGERSVRRSVSISRTASEVVRPEQRPLGSSGTQRAGAARERGGGPAPKREVEHGGGRASDLGERENRLGRRRNPGVSDCKDAHDRPVSLNISSRTVRGYYRRPPLALHSTSRPRAVRWRFDTWRSSL